MISNLTLTLSATHPEMPLDSSAVFKDSAVTFRIVNVPDIPQITVASVNVSVTNAAGTAMTVAAVRDGDEWFATFPATHFAAVGAVRGSVIVSIAGTDENGTARTWVAGIGNLKVLSRSATPAPGETVDGMRLFAAQPTAPKDGDVWPTLIGYAIWQDGEAHNLGGFTPTEEQLAAMNSGITGETVAQLPDTIAKADAALSRAEAEAGFTEWTYSGLPTGAVITMPPTYVSANWNFVFAVGDVVFTPVDYASGDEGATSLEWTMMPDDGVTPPVSVTATRTRLPTMADIPTDNAQLANGAGYATTAAMNAALALKADQTALPYALVNVTQDMTAPMLPSDAFPVAYTITGDSYSRDDMTGLEFVNRADGTPGFILVDSATMTPLCLFLADGTLDSNIASCTFGGESSTSLMFPYILLDRTMNQLALQTLPASGIALTFPAATAGKVRDFLVRLTIPAGDAPQIAYPSDVEFGNSAAEFPDINTDESDAAETILMFTETAPYVANATPAKFLVKGEAWKEVS